MEYIRGSETLYNLFSTDPAVSCDASKQVSNREMYTLCRILLHFIYMGQMDFISSTFVRFFCQNYLGSISLITRYTCICGSVHTACAF